jgi:hypothetical protein
VVNYFNGNELGQCYYISNVKLYRKMKCGEYRELMTQDSSYFTFYFIKNKTSGKSRIGIERVNEMEYKEDSVKEKIVKEKKIKKDKFIVKIEMSNDGLNVINTNPDKVIVIVENQDKVVE